MTLSTWLTFFVASWLISFSPGAGAISCMSVGMREGYRRALWNIAGLELGIALLIAIVAAGLGAVLAASAMAFAAIKWLGVAYLIFLGIQQWRAKVETVRLDAGTGARRTPGQLVTQGFLINASNPKAIVFMLAVLPQFIDLHTPQLPQYAVMIATLICTDLVAMSIYALLAAKVLAALREPHHIQWLNRTFGGLFIGAGLLLASFKRSV